MAVNKPRFEDIVDLFKNLMLPFYDVHRDISVRTKKRRQENDAEHSWSLAFLACSLATEIDDKLDVGKVCMFAVVHDVVEVFAGDTSVWSEKSYLASKQAREEMALKTIRLKYKAFPWIAATIHEYEQKKSHEAIFVYALDKFLNNLLVYADKNLHNLEKYKMTKRVFNDFIVGHRKKAHSHKAVGYYYDELLQAFESHPEYFVSKS